MKKHIHWDPSIKDTIITKTCVCEGCPYCKNKNKQYCDIFTHNRCKECNDYKCINCLYNKEICNYCMRII